MHTKLFRAMGYRVTALKIDPYLNVDAGTMSPFEHGEGKLLNHMHMLMCCKIHSILHLLLHTNPI